MCDFDRDQLDKAQGGRGRAVDKDAHSEKRE
jgi:hypothetical protein